MDRYFGISSKIARWKRHTYLEKALCFLADKCELGKRLYVFYYKVFDREYYIRGEKFINAQLETYKDQWTGLKYSQVSRDMIYCLHRMGISFQDYWIYGFINKSLYCRKSFVADKLRYYYCDILNAPHISHLMTDKYACYKEYKEFFKRDVVGCFRNDDFDVFANFVAKHNRFIYKPFNEHSGHGIKIYTATNDSSQRVFSDLLAHGPFVAEELIAQGEEVARMHSACINSCRVVTFYVNGKVHIIGVTWRIGVGNAVMDNAGSGGIYASVDPRYGFVQTDAINYKGQHFNIHPDSKVPIVGFQLPEWNEALALIKGMATQIEGTTLISWDIAYSDKGWLMVEANENGDWSIIQSNKQIGKKSELFALMDEYFNQN